MPMQLLPPELDWLANGLLVTLALGLVAGVLTGLSLLVRPSWVFALNSRWSRWVEVRPQLEPLEQPYSIERSFYRHHRLAGGMIAIGAGFVLWVWAFAYSREGTTRLLGGRWESPELSWLVPAGEWVVVFLHLLILVVGVVIAVRPSLLKSLESEGNRWYDPGISASLDRTFSPIERAFQLHPRLSGLLLLSLATVCLVGLAPTLARLLS